MTQRQRGDLAKRDAPGAQRTAAMARQTPDLSAKLTVKQKAALMKLEKGEAVTDAKDPNGIHPSVAKSLENRRLVHIQKRGGLTIVDLTLVGSAALQKLKKGPTDIRTLPSHRAAENISQRLGVLNDARQDVVQGKLEPGAIKPMRKALMADLRDRTAGRAGARLIGNLYYRLQSFAGDSKMSHAQREAAIADIGARVSRLISKMSTPALRVAAMHQSDLPHGKAGNYYFGPAESLKVFHSTEGSHKTVARSDRYALASHLLHWLGNTLQDHGVSVYDKGKKITINHER